MINESPISPAVSIRIDSLPLEQQAPFSAWIEHQTRPVALNELDSNGNPAACAWDGGIAPDGSLKAAQGTASR